MNKTLENCNPPCVRSSRIPQDVEEAISAAVEDSET